MTYNYICLNCNRMMEIQPWSSKSCDCGGVFVSRAAVEEAYDYLSGKKDPMPLNGAGLARELVSIGADIKRKDAKRIVTNAHTEVDKEKRLLWLIVELDHNIFAPRRYLVGQIDLMPDWVWDMDAEEDEEAVEFDDYEGC